MRRVVLVLTGVAALALTISGTAAATPVSGQGWAQRAPQPTVQHLCAAATPGFATCFAEVRRTSAPAGVRSLATTSTPAGYAPNDLRSAYALPAASGAQSGRTVAIVDAYDDPRAETDLAGYRATYGLPACTTSNGCFRKVNQNGGTSYPSADAGWAGEISLDLDMVSAICPTCHILLVEATSSSMTDLGTAVNRAVTLGARYVSNSYGGAERSSQASVDNAYFHHPGVAITASTGDSGYGVSYPASSQYVTAVGGTSLRRSASTRGWTESAWSGAGSGCSAYEPKPATQHDTGCSRRTVADVSAVADPNTGVAVYDSYDDDGWLVFGGTSAAAPIIAAVYALAGVPAAGTMPNRFPYDQTSALNDVAAGSNGSCGGSYLCTAKAGYDGPTGLGTPKGVTAFTSTPSQPLPRRWRPQDQTGPLPVHSGIGSEHL